MEGVSFILASGQCLWLKGANGAGKSTLLATLAGLIPPLSGHIHWQGTGLHTEDEIVFCHYLGHSNAIKPSLSARQQLSFWAALYQSPLALDAILAEFGLAHLADLALRYASQGQKRRLALTRLRLSYKPLWLLDEPTAGLDTKGLALFEHLLASHLQSGGMAMIASHEPLASCKHIMTLTA
jgi:heme exporter protein A